MSTINQKYIISEFHEFSADRGMILEAEKKGGLITLVGILQKADTLNRNGRVYPFEILKREATNYMEQVEQRTAYGELDHPDSAVISLVNVSHMVVDMWWEGSTLYGKVVIFDEHPSGAKLKAILKCGGVLGISSRGVGSVKSIGGNDVVQEDFELIGFDFVSSPSTPGAYMFKEGKEIGMKGMVKLDNGEVDIVAETDVEKAIKENINKYNKLYTQLNDSFWGKM
jgi:hypothetical protein